jgi:hypothetical protein
MDDLTNFVNGEAERKVSKVENFLELLLSQKLISVFSSTLNTNC